MKGFFPKHQNDIEHILREASLSEDKLLSIMDEIYTAYSLAEVTERELKKNRESYSIHYKRKADEYEAKAEAFDEIFKLYIGYEDGWINFPRGRMSFNKEIINVCKCYESGGFDD